MGLIEELQQNLPLHLQIRPKSKERKEKGVVKLAKMPRCLLQQLPQAQIGPKFKNFEAHQIDNDSTQKRLC